MVTNSNQHNILRNILHQGQLRILSCMH